MISQTAEYALRATVSLAAAFPTPTTVQTVSEAVSVPVPYLAKVLSALARAGVVKSQRGKRGGFTLTLPPSRTSVLEVVQAVDPIMRLKGCPLGKPEHDTGLCPLHRRLDDAAALTEEAFRATFLADLVDTPGAGHGPTRCLGAQAPEEEG